MARIIEGCMPFRGAHTYYRIIGDISTRFPTPIVLLHGGPGSTHNYFEMLDPLADEGMQLIMYDQIGCGLSYVASYKHHFFALINITVGKFSDCCGFTNAINTNN